MQHKRPWRRWPGRRADRHDAGLQTPARTASRRAEQRRTRGGRGPGRQVICRQEQHVHVAALGVPAAERSRAVQVGAGQRAAQHRAKLGGELGREPACHLASVRSHPFMIADSDAAATAGV
jgi:hypothetical protein